MRSPRLTSAAPATASAMCAFGPAAAQHRATGAPAPVRSDMDPLRRLIEVPVEPKHATFEMRILGTPGGFGPAVRTLVVVTL